MCLFLAFYPLFTSGRNVLVYHSYHPTLYVLYLYLFIEKYKNSSLKEISRFASGLERDLPAVENSVASPLSNGFVEGTNSKLKMIKRTMYGRCGKELLAAKLICSSTVNG